MRWSDDVNIETPEQIDVQLEIAGLGSRFVAKLYDWLVKWGMLAVIGVVIALAAALLGASFSSATPPMMLIALLVALFYAFLLGFDLFFELRHNGQTPGKKLAGIRVVREGGGPIDFRSSSIRNLLGLADFLPSFYFLGALIALLTARNQRLGDLAAGTIVIRERAFQPPVELEEEIARLGDEQFTFTADQLKTCLPADRHLLRSYFQRQQDMEPGPRMQLALKLAEKFLVRMAYPSTEPIQDGLQASAFLASLYRDLESWAREGR